MSLFEAVCVTEEGEKSGNFGIPGMEDLPFPRVNHRQLVILKEQAHFQNLSLNDFVIWPISTCVTLCILNDFYCLQHFI